MNTQPPRAWLLSRHESAASQLDAIRHEVLAETEGGSNFAPGHLGSSRGFRLGSAIWIGAGSIAAASIGLILVRQSLHEKPGAGSGAAGVMSAPATGTPEAVNRVTASAPAAPASSIRVGDVLIPQAGALVAPDGTQLDADSGSSGGANEALVRAYEFYVAGRYSEASEAAAKGLALPNLGSPQVRQMLRQIHDASNQHRLAGGGPAGGGGSIGKVYGASEVDAAPMATLQIGAVYPPSLRSSGLDGRVDLRLVVNEDGVVVLAEVISSSDPRFDSSARDSVRKWKFRPGRVGDRNVVTSVEVTVHFQAPGRR